MLLSEPLVEEWAERFRGARAEDIERSMQSFAFKNCRQRTELADILAGYAE
jgi:hypothetical protein